jgi:methanogenic corrinoid protein MtbC1
MHELVEKIAICVEKGKINKQSPFPPDLKDQDGSDELTVNALEQDVKPAEILEGCMLGMERIGKKFSENKVFVPELLMAAKAMSAVMNHLKPYFQSGEVKRKGMFIIGTVTGDLHDIGKNLVSMSIEGAGWEVIDLGVDVSSDKFLTAIANYPNSAVGLSALLTTTMVNMESIVKEIKEKYPEMKILVGGAPLTQEYCDKIGADFYSPDPQGAVNYLNTIAG